MQVLRGHLLLTYNLHLTAMQVPDQARCSGAVFFGLEYWDDRMVQLYKRCIKYWTTAHRLLLFVQDQLLSRACDAARADGCAHGHSCMALAKAWGSNRNQDTGLDVPVADGDAVDCMRLLPAFEQCYLLPDNDTVLSATGLGRLLHENLKIRTWFPDLMRVPDLATNGADPVRGPLYEMWVVNLASITSGRTDARTDAKQSSRQTFYDPFTSCLAAL